MFSALKLRPGVVEGLMRDALGVAREGMMAGEAPIGCVIARGDGQVVARAHNEQRRSGDKVAHAEIVAFHRAAGTVPRDAKDLILVSTLEPCVMCTGAAMEAGVRAVIFGLHAPADSGTGRVKPPTSPESSMPHFVGGVCEKEARALFEQWIEIVDDPQQREFGKQLLALTKGVKDGGSGHGRAREGM